MTGTTHPGETRVTTSGADVVLATVRAGTTHGQRPGSAARTPHAGGATSLTLDRPGARLRPEVWQWLLSGLLAVAVTAVSIPLLAVLYDLFVPVAFLLSAAHAVALLLASVRPHLAIGLSAWSTLAIALVSLGASHLSDLAWPLPVATLVTALLVLGLIGLRGDVRTAVIALLVSVAAASVPLVVTLADGDLWQAAVPNLLTFHSVAVLVTGAALVASRIPRGVSVAE